MNVLTVHLLFVGVPLTLVVVLSLLIWSRPIAAAFRGGSAGPHPATYKISDEWTHEPILWAAVDEVIGGHGHGAGANDFTVGGSASGKW